MRTVKQMSSTAEKYRQFNKLNHKIQNTAVSKDKQLNQKMSLMNYMLPKTIGVDDLS